MGKNSRRKKSPQKAPAEALQEFHDSVCESQQRVTLRVLQEDHSPRALVSVGLKAQGAYAQLNKKLEKPRLACQRGCDYCCYPPVSATVPELINLVAYAMTHKNQADMQRLTQRVTETFEKTRDMTSEERYATSLACPMLEDGMCSVYDARPLACRGYNSMDVKPCKEGFERPADPPPVPGYAPYLVASRALTKGVLDGLEAAGLPNVMLDLTKGLQVLLQSDPTETVERWMNGEQVFAGAEAFTEPD